MTEFHLINVSAQEGHKISGNDYEDAIQKSGLLKHRPMNFEEKTICQIRKSVSSINLSVTAIGLIVFLSLLINACQALI